MSEYQLITAKDDGTDSIVIKLKDKPPTLYGITPVQILDNIYTVPYNLIGEWAYSYTMDVIRGRWIEGEEAIKRSSGWAYFYARDVIEDRWVEGEEAIKRNDYWWEAYKKHFKVDCHD